MIIDIAFAIFIVLAIFQGLSKGFIISLFSVAALLLGIAAALKLSAKFSIYLQPRLQIDNGWLAVISFLVIFFIVVWIVNLLGRLLDKVIKFAMLGWINRLLGVLLYLFINTVLFSILLWLANQLYLINPSVKASSHIYDWVAPVGPKVINSLGVFIPQFKGVFHQLELFFDKAAAALDKKL